jgi:mannose-6-phosphate isomerase-like protein (cupin superfamily)
MAKKDWVSAVSIIAKPWGHEEHFALANGLYCGKVLFIKEGHALSLQLHESKDETVAVQRGHIILDIGRDQDMMESFDLLPGESVRIRPTTVHRMTAVADSYVLEASTTQLDDIIRLADRYGRAAVSWV